MNIINNYLCEENVTFLTGRLEATQHGILQSC